jgi:hypothetical protein
MKKDEAEQAMPTLVDAWIREAGEPADPDGKHHYSFVQFWMWLERNHSAYTRFRASPNAKYVAEMWFDEITRQTWRT